MGNGQDLLTIKAFAEASGRSQQTIYKQIETRLAPYLHKIEGKKYIERRALQEVFEIEVEQPTQPEKDNSFNSENNPEHPLYAILKAELDAKNRQIDQLMDQLKTKETEVLNLTEALRDAQSSLKAAQALHAGTMQQQLEAGEQPDRECQDETAIDAELVDPEQPEAAPEQKPKFKERLKKALEILMGE